MRNAFGSSFMQSICGAVLLAVAVLRSTNEVAVAQENPFTGQYLNSLKQAGISASKEDLGPFLRQHHRTLVVNSSVAELILQLGDDDFFVREAAMQKLVLTATPGSIALEAAAKSSDPEVRWRAKVVLEQSANKPKNDLLYAAFVVIHTQKVVGLADDILGCAPVCGSDHLKQALIRALEASAVADDIPKLRKALSSTDVFTRLAVATVLSKLAGDEAKPDLMTLLKDPNESVKLLAAEQLAKSATPEALIVLGELLDSEVTVIRTRTSQILRPTLKTDLPYSAFAPPETRKLQADALRALIKQQTQK